MWPFKSRDYNHTKELCSRTLILMADDGISGLAWARRVKRFLDAGLNVVAVSTADNEYNCIGIGDGLPSYEDQGFLTHPGFTKLTITCLSDSVLHNIQTSAGPGTVICWNMDPFELSWLQNDQLGLERLIQLSLTGPFKSMFVRQADDWRSGDKKFAPALKALSFDAFAGVHLAPSFEAVALLNEIAPKLAQGLNRPISGGGPCRWEALDSEGWHKHIIQGLP